MPMEQRTEGAEVFETYGKTDVGDGSVSHYEILIVFITYILYYTLSVSPN